MQKYGLFFFILIGLSGCGDSIDEEKLVRTYFLPARDSATIDHSFRLGSKVNQKGLNKVIDIDQTPVDIGALRKISDKFYKESKAVANDEDCEQRLDTARANMEYTLSNPTTLTKEDLKYEIAWYLHTYYFEKAKEDKLKIDGSEVYYQILKGDIPAHLANLTPQGDQEEQWMSSTDIFVLGMAFLAILLVSIVVNWNALKSRFSSQGKTSSSIPTPKMEPIKVQTQPENIISTPSPPKPEPVIQAPPPKPEPLVTVRSDEMETYSELISDILGEGPASADASSTTNIEAVGPIYAAPPALPPALPDTMPFEPPPHKDIVYQLKFASQPQGTILHKIAESFIPYETYIVLAIDPAKPMNAELRFTDDVETRGFILNQPQMLHAVCIMPDKPLPSSAKDITQKYGRATKKDNYWIIQDKIELLWV